MALEMTIMYSIISTGNGRLLYIFLSAVFVVCVFLGISFSFFTFLFHFFICIANFKNLSAPTTKE